MLAKHTRNGRQSLAGGLTAIYLSLIFVFIYLFNVCHSACVWSKETGNLAVLIIVPRSSIAMSFIFFLIDEIKFTPISSRHFCIRGCNVCLFCWNYFAISSWTKRLTLDLKIVITFWRQRGNGAVEVSLESRTAQMSTFTFWYSLS